MRYVAVAGFARSINLSIYRYNLYLTILSLLWTTHFHRLLHEEFHMINTLHKWLLRLLVSKTHILYLDTVSYSVTVFFITAGCPSMKWCMQANTESLTFSDTRILSA